MTDLDIYSIPHADFSPELQREIGALDRLAFGDIGGELSSIQWATPDWVALGYLRGQLVTQLCIPKREIKVGHESVWVAWLPIQIFSIRGSDLHCSLRLHAL